MILTVSLLGAAIFNRNLRRSLAKAPYLIPQAVAHTPLPKTSVIIPAYNEAENIEACVTTVLNSTSLSPDELDVWVVDDQSTDETWAVVQSLHQRLNDLRLNLLAGQPKPVGETWVGKNWACTQAVEKARGEFLLFIDADVRLKPGAIEAAVQTAQSDQIDLLSCGPAIICGCFSEWLVQPLMFSAITVGYRFEEVNDPKSETAFAAGPFMFFRRSAYERVGGHRAVADQVVEDVELGRLVKKSGLTLRFFVGTQVAAVQMYRSWEALWEGWTKNIHMGARRDVAKTLKFAIVMFLVFAVPWLGLVALMGKALVVPFNQLDGVAIVLCLISIAIHYNLRQIAAKVAQIPPKYWWLTGVGGILVATITLGSIFKTETGWGWTWRGRSLAQR